MANENDGGEAGHTSVALASPGRLRVQMGSIYNWAVPLVNGLEPNIPYRAYYYDPVRDVRDDRCIVINRDPVEGEKKHAPFTDGRKHAEIDLKPRNAEGHTI